MRASEEAALAGVHEAIVIGTGFGGAVAACRLAQAGYDVLVLERGRRFGPDDFPAAAPPGAALPDLERWFWQLGHGVWEVLDLDGITSTQAAGYGGGSLIYANVHLRPPESVFDERWPVAYRGSALRDYFNLAAWTLEPEPVTEHEQPLGRPPKADQFVKAATGLGRGDAVFHPPLTIRTSKGENRQGRQQNACTGCGRCCSGCPETAKSTLDLNYLARAEDRGARVRTLCEVVDIQQMPSGVWRVEALDHLAGGRLVFSTRHLFLCAGVVHSARLLSKATLLPESRPVQRRVGTGYFTGGDSIGIIYDTEHPQHPSFGPIITTSLVHYPADTPGTFTLLQEGGIVTDFARLFGILRAQALVGSNRHTRSGKARVEPSALPEPAQGLFTPPWQETLRSPLDAAFDAIGRSGSPSRDALLERIVPEQLRGAWSSLLDEVMHPMLLPPAVARTIDGATRERHARWPLTRWLDPEGAILPRLRAFERAIIRGLFGTDEEIARRALGELVSASGLTHHELASRLLHYESAGNQRRTMLLAMGTDARPSRLRYDRSLDRMIAELDLDGIGPAFATTESLMADMASMLGGELRTNPLWETGAKPVTVHGQGGCGMSDSPETGVTDPDGRVHGCPGLYVFDAASLPGPVGVNPSATITAVAERNVERFIAAHPPAHPSLTGAREYARERQASARWDEEATARGWVITPPPSAPTPPPSTPRVGISFSERLTGHHAPASLEPGFVDETYRGLERKGRPASSVELDLTVTIPDLLLFLTGNAHVAGVQGKARITGLPGEAAEDLPVTGTLEFVRGADQDPGAKGPAANSLLRYRVAATDGSGLELSGYKRIQGVAGMEGWRDAATVFLVVRRRDGSRGVLLSAGVVHVDLEGFLFRQLPSMRVTGTDDPARVAWAMAKFAAFFFGWLRPETAAEVSTLAARLSPLGLRTRAQVARETPQEPRA